MSAHNFFIILKLFSYVIVYYDITSYFIIIIASNNRIVSTSREDRGSLDSGKALFTLLIQS